MDTQVIETSVGELVAQWSEKGLYSCEFRRSTSKSKTTSNREAPKCQREQDLANSFERYFATGELDWSLEDLDWTGVPEFHRKALEHCFAIPCGQTKTYGQLASDLGSPNAARAVGGAMAKNRWPILIPCHRVVGASGQLTGYSGTGGIDTKRHLLDLERSWAGALLFA